LAHTLAVHQLALNEHTADWHAVCQLGNFPLWGSIKVQNPTAHKFSRRPDRHADFESAAMEFPERCSAAVAVRLLTNVEGPQTMAKSPIVQRALLAAVLVLAPSAPPAIADVTFFDDLADFQAVSTTSVAATFETVTPTETPIFIPPSPPITLGGVTFTPHNTGTAFAPNLFIATPSTLTDFSVDPASDVLTMSGNENFEIDFSSAPTAVGFETYLNPYDPPVVKVYDTTGNLLATHALTQAAATRGFLGITSTVAIGTVSWKADDGDDVNTAIDNVRVGTTNPVVPHVLTFYLHGNDIPGTAGGLTMNQNPASSQLFNVNLFYAPTWFSDPAVTGTVPSGGQFKLIIARTVGLSLPTTFRLASTDLDGGNEQELGQITQGIGLGFSPKTVTIPVATPATLNNRRLKLTVSSAFQLNLNLQIGTSSYLTVTQFVGTP
jgi:hypothetical protein